MKAHWTKNKEMILKAIKEDDSPDSLIALEICSLLDSLNFKESGNLARLLIELASK